MMRMRAAAFAVMLIIVAAQAANATPITFTFRTTGAGTWTQSDGTAVDFGLSTLIEVTLVADTSELQNPTLTFPIGNPLPAVIGYGFGTSVTASLAVAGVPFGAFANPAYVFRNGPVTGFGDSADFDVFGLITNALSGYDLVSPLPPTLGFPYFAGTTAIALASGDTVTLTELSEQYGVYFSAELTPDQLPEPATLSLLLTVLAALPFGRGIRKRFRPIS